VYLEAGDGGLTEDLIEGYVSFSRGGPLNRIAISTADELTRELQYIPSDRSYRILVVRNAQALMTRNSMESLLWLLESQRRSSRLRVVLVGEEPHERVKQWFEENVAYGVVTEPSFEKLGAWMATKTAGRWDYRKQKTEDWLITEKTGLALMEHVGWDYTAALQAAKTIRAYADDQVMDWPQVSALVPAKVGFGYADALVFGKGRRNAYTLSDGIVGSDTLRTLGLVRFYLRQFAKLRSANVENLSDRGVAEETGVHVWHWKQKYKPVYASYTNDRIRLRLEATERAMLAARAGAVTGVLEVLVAEW
jgi:hypothetical protein